MDKGDHLVTGTCTYVLIEALENAQILTGCQNPALICLSNVSYLWPQTPRQDTKQSIEQASEVTEW